MVGLGCGDGAWAGFRGIACNPDPAVAAGLARLARRCGGDPAPQVRRGHAAQSCLPLSYRASHASELLPFGAPMMVSVFFTVAGRADLPGGRRIS